MLAMIPDCSANGMNEAGNTKPRVGWFQRMRASHPVTAPVLSSRCG